MSCLKERLSHIFIIHLGMYATKKSKCSKTPGFCNCQMQAMLSLANLGIRVSTPVMDHLVITELCYFCGSLALKRQAINKFLSFHTVAVRLI